MRIRKNIECLSTNELHDLREAFAGIYALPESNPKSFARIAGLHGSPSPSYCNHSATSGFLSWHRAYLMEMENALRDVVCNVTLPFWDWNSTTDRGIPEACKSPTYINRSGATVDNPLYRGPIAPSAGGGFTTRRSDINTVSFEDYATSAASNQSESNFTNYANTLNGIHGGVHVRFSGSMSSVALAAFDPIFYFHHANVDRLWAAWQATTGGVLPSSELNATLQPFTKPFSSDWHVGSDFENISDWDYRYRTFCFVLPPFIWPELKLVRFKVQPWIFNSKRINLVLRSDRMLMKSIELRVFINDEEASAKSKMLDNKNFAGSIGIFGMGEAHGTSIHGSQPSVHKIDITECLQSCIKKRDKEVSIHLVPVSADKRAFNVKKAEPLQVELETY